MHEALKRNHTIYLSNNSIPIFDRYLSDNILSILPNKNTNALTIKVGVTPDYSLDLDTLEIIPSIIKNKHKLTYQGAEEIITNTGLLHDDLILISKIFDKQAIDNPRVRAYHQMKERINNQNIMFIILYYSVAIFSLYNYIEYKKDSNFLKQIEELNESLLNNRYSLEDSLKIINIKLNKESLDTLLEDINIFKDTLLSNNKTKTLKPNN